jgi:hypothetical protein
MYETGIVHTLENSNSITQHSMIPSDLGHHRVQYLPNDEGYRNFIKTLQKNLEL